MAVERFISQQFVEDARLYPIEEHGKYRMQYFEVAATTVVGDANSTIDLCLLPPGRVRVLPYLIAMDGSALGAGRTFTIGHRKYQKRGAYNGQTDLDEAENLSAFATGIDLAAAGRKTTPTAALKYDVYSYQGVTIAGQFLGGNVPVGATLRGFVPYLYE